MARNAIRKLKVSTALGIINAMWDDLPQFLQDRILATVVTHKAGQVQQPADPRKPR